MKAAYSIQVAWFVCLVSFLGYALASATAPAVLARVPSPLTSSADQLVKDCERSVLGSTHCSNEPVSLGDDSSPLPSPASLTP
jgi:hypothetical protein